MCITHKCTRTHTHTYTHILHEGNPQNQYGEDYEQGGHIVESVPDSVAPPAAGDRVGPDSACVREALAQYEC